MMDRRLKKYGIIRANQILDQVFDEITTLIEKSTERGQFNAWYFEKPFKRWFAQKLEELDK